MRHGFARLLCLASLLVLVGAVPAWAGDPVRELAGAERLSCAFVKGITAVFNQQGGVVLRPPLNPNTPGLAIAITDRSKGLAVLEEDALETPGTLKYGPEGLSVLARDPGGNTTLVTVFPLYAGVSDNFLMVSSRHGVGPRPQLSQRYGMCRAVSATPPAPAPAAPPAAHQ